MINALVRLITGKDVILYNPHRQTLPLVSNSENRNRYIFIPINKLWSSIPVPGKYKLKYKLMYGLLNAINPVCILDVNWIGKGHRLYYLWAKHNPGKEFIVVQHGLYIAGVIADAAHRFTKCTIMLCWSSYFTEVFREYNQHKTVRLLNFGNTIFNSLKRKTSYPTKRTNKILLAPTAVGGDRIQHLLDFYHALTQIGFDVFVKQHNFQARLFGDIPEVPALSGDLMQLLEHQEFDIVVSDHSSALIDAIFHKNCVLWFGPGGELPSYRTNVYSEYLVNVSDVFKQWTKPQDLYDVLDINAQEELFHKLISSGNNSLLPFLN
jgi:hypothetical protein